jgi:uncharacterized membrane protein YoaK (UPF0700 family)
LSERRARDGLLLALTFTAGAVDAFSYLGLGRVFTANMTGNIVLMGVAVGQGQAQSTVRSGLALVGFVAGVVLGTALAGGGRERVWPSRVTVALGVELLLLTLLALGWGVRGGRPGSPAIEALIATSALAMGVQTAATRRLSVSGVATTYVTGTLTSLVAQLTVLTGSRAEWARWTSVLLALLMGAGVEAFGAMRWWPLAPVLPMSVLAAVVIFALLRRAGDEPGDEGPGLT